MSGAETDKPQSNMMIHAEVEKALRQSRAYLARLRLEKKLGCSRGRPTSIDEKYLEIYIARMKQRRVARPKKLRQSGRSKKPGDAFNYVPAGVVPGPFNLLTIAEVAIKFGRSLRQIRYLCSHGNIPLHSGRGTADRRGGYTGTTFRRQRHLLWKRC